MNKQSKPKKLKVKCVSHKCSKNITRKPIIQNMINPVPSDTDPSGSYTGNPIKSYETPVQDADDL